MIATDALWRTIVATKHGNEMGGGDSLVLSCLRWAMAIMFLLFAGCLVWGGDPIGSYSSNVLYCPKQRGLGG